MSPVRIGLSSRSSPILMGRYDMVVVSEGKDDESASRVALALGAGGAIRTETFRAFNEEEYRKIIAGLP
jgi:uncharacterized protein with GYD domain